MDTRPKRLFYGWIIVAVAFVCLALVYGVYYSFPVFFVPIIHEFGWSRASTALIGSIGMVVYALTSPLAGLAVDRLGPRVVVSAGGVLLGGALFLCSQVTEPWHIYVFYGVIANIGINLSGSLVNFIVLANWFSRRRGTAIGIAAAGIGVGTFILAPVTQKAIDLAGWRAAYLLLAGIVLAVIPALAIAFHRHRPEKMGLLPDGGPPRGDGPTAGRPRPAVRVVDKAWAEFPWTLRSAAATTRFWFIFASLFFASLAHQSVIVHQVAYLTDGGLDPLVGASVVGLVGLTGGVGKLFWGWMSDRIGREAAYTLGMGCIAAGVLVLALAIDESRPWGVYLYAAVFGMGYGVSAPLNPSIVADVFQGRRFGSIYGAVYIGSGAGAATGPLASGFIFDVTRSYMAAFVMAGAAALLAAACVWIVAPRKVRQVPGVAARARPEPGAALRES